MGERSDISLTWGMRRESSFVSSCMLDWTLKKKLLWKLKKCANCKMFWFPCYRIYWLFWKLSKLLVLLHFFNALFCPILHLLLPRIGKCKTYFSTSVALRRVNPIGKGLKDIATFIIIPNFFQERVIFFNSIKKVKPEILAMLYSV